MNKTISLLRETNLRLKETSSIVLSMDSAISLHHPALADYSRKLTSTLLPLVLFCGYGQDQLLDMIDHFLAEAKELGYPEEQALDLCLLNIIDLMQRRTTIRSLIVSAQAISEAAYTGKIDRRSIINGESWDHDSSQLLGLLQAKHVAKGLASVEQTVLKAHRFYTILEREEWDSTVSTAFSAANTDEIIAEEFDPEDLRSCARELYKEAEERNWDGSNASLLIVCYADDILRGSCTAKDLISAADALYEEAKRHDRQAGKRWWWDEDAARIGISNALTVSCTRIDPAEMVAAIDTAYAYFAGAFPRTGWWIFKSNAEWAKDIAFSFISSLSIITGLSGAKDAASVEDVIERQAINDVLEREIEEELSSQATTSTLMMMTAVSVAINASTR